MSRHDARIAAVRAVYCGEYSKNTNSCESLLFDGLSLDSDDKYYYEQIISKISDHIDDIASIIKDNTKNWKIDRISKVDMAILRVAIFEIMFDENIPDKAAVDEAVRIAKEYSTEKSSSYINGVLAGVLKKKTASKC